MGGRIGLALLVVLCVPAAAHADIDLTITTAGERFYEDDPLTVAATNYTGGARIVIRFGPAEGECAADPAGDPRPLVLDRQTTDGVESGSISPPDPGLHRACAWELDGSGAIRARGQALEQVVAQVAETGVSFELTRVWRGIPIRLFANAYGREGRVLQAALLRTVCPAVAPAAADPVVVRWLGAPGGGRMGDGERLLGGDATLDGAGVYHLCSWVGEQAGDPAPEGVASDRLTVVGGRSKPFLGLTADRSTSSGSTPVRWSALVGAAFRGTLRLEARKVVHSPSGALRESGPWKRIASLDLAKQRVRRGGYSFGLGASAYLRISGKTQLPPAIGRQCGNQPRMARVRLRYLGSATAAPARSKVIELLGSLGGCR